MNKNKLIDKLFLIIVSILTIVMGITFIVQILRIYYGNNANFTREICGEYILQILPIIILWVVIIIASSIYFRLKSSQKREVAKATNAGKLKALEAICQIDKENLNDECKELHKEKKKVKIAKIICLIIILICLGMSLGYLLNVSHFDANGDLVDQAIKMSIHLIPWVVISLGSIIGLIIYEEYSSNKSINIIKNIIKNNGKKEVKKYDNRKERIAINIARISILTISVVLIIVGIFDGTAADVLQKAINICTECIGLG